MKNLHKLIIGCLSIVLFGFGIGQPKEDNKDEVPGLEGTWKLVSYKYGGEENFSQVPPFVEYRKTLTKNHFTWVSFGENGDDVIGAGGGTYTIKGNKYTETSEYFYPMGKSVAGTSTVFTYSIDGNFWRISGIIKSVKIDPKTGKHDKVEEIQLEEVWERM